MKRNLKYTMVFACVMLIAACSTSTMITSSWRKPGATANRYHNIFIAALTSNVPVKREVEDDLQQMLQQRGFTVEKSSDVFPPNFSNQTGQRRELVLGKIQSTGADAILTIALLRQETESHYIPGSGGYWNPGLRFGYYGTFWGYYNNWYPYVYSPGYYDQTKVYYLETNLYDARSEALVWAAQSKTYQPDNIHDFLRGYLKSVHDEMVKDGLIRDNNTMASR